MITKVADDAHGELLTATTQPGGFKIINWPSDVETCIRCTTYPTKIP